MRDLIINVMLAYAPLYEISRSQIIARPPKLIGVAISTFLKVQFFPEDINQTAVQMLDWVYGGDKPGWVPDEVSLPGAGR
jgi:hypothetical protein